MDNRRSFLLNIGRIAIAVAWVTEPFSGGGLGPGGRLLVRTAQ